MPSSNGKRCPRTPVSWCGVRSSPNGTEQSMLRSRSLLWPQRSLTSISTTRRTFLCVLWIGGFWIGSAYLAAHCFRLVKRTILSMMLSSVLLPLRHY
ncbi:hypothetical protein HYQ44_006545 [Verticillium longisporum]|nr:hypothetical protein HYQ44_006545 [Verticillium longisporum]